MVDLRDLETKIRSLERIIVAREDIEAIRELKYKYFRCLDTKRWDELVECFTEDVRASYVFTARVGGKYDCQGVDAVMRFLKKVLGVSSRISMHQGHHPEIEIISDRAARGVWQLQDCLIDTQANTSLLGTSFYYDEYAKIDGKWRIRSIDSARIFEETWDRADIKSLKLTANMFSHLEK